MLGYLTHLVWDKDKTMGTRACVARLVERAGGVKGFEGPYIHWDGYPEGVGQTLYRECRRLSPERVMGTLLTRRSGWSNVAGAKLDDAPVNMRERFGSMSNGPEYYPDDEGEMICTETSDNGIEYCYAFEQVDGRWLMHVLSSVMPDGSQMVGMFGMSHPDWHGKWREIGCVDLSDPTEPDWATMGAND